MHNLALALYDSCFGANVDVHSRLHKLKQVTTVFGSHGELKELADIAFALKESIGQQESILKQLNETFNLVEKLTAALWAKENNPEPIRTEYVTASPRIKIMATLPTQRNDPENFAKFMNSLGVAEHVWNRESALVRPHWPAVVDWISEQAAHGAPLPDGVDPSKTYTVYKLNLRQRKELPKSAVAAGTTTSAEGN